MENNNIQDTNIDNTNNEGNNESNTTNNVFDSFNCPVHSDFCDQVCNNITEVCCDSHLDGVIPNYSNCNCNNGTDRSISSLYLILTENCNLRCRYCFEGKTRQTVKTMSKDVAFKAVDFLIKCISETNEQGEITFFGGEPMLCPDLMIDILDYTNKKMKESNVFIKFAIITNGTIWNDDIKRFFDKWIEYQPLNVQLSYDSIPEIQDSDRPCANPNMKSSDLAKKASEKYIEYYKEHNIDMTNLHIHACISKKSIPYIYDAYRYFAEELHLENIFFAWIIEEDWDDEDCVIFDEQHSKILEYICSKDIPEYRYPFKHFDEMSGCSSGKKLICVDTDGIVYPCHRFYFYNDKKRDKFVYGNIFDENPISNKELRETLCTTYPRDSKHDYPCQICIACNYDTTGDYLTRPNDYDEEFMKIINYYYNEFMTFKKTKNSLNEISNIINSI